MNMLHPRKSPEDLSVEKYPHLMRYFGLDRLIDPMSGRPVLLNSPQKGSPESQANNALIKISREGRVDGYIWNRLREHVMLVITRNIIQYPIEISSIVNDVLYGVDAIMYLPQGDVAIDFTLNPYSIESKLHKGGTLKNVMDSERNIRQLSLMVIWMREREFYQIMDDLEMLFSQGHRFSGEELNSYVQKEILQTLLHELGKRGIQFNEYFQCSTRNPILSRDIRPLVSDSVEAIVRVSDNPPRSRSQ